TTIAVAAASCGGKTSGKAWILASTECVGGCSVELPVNFLEMLSLEDDHATLTERAGGCLMTVSDIPFVQTSEGVHLDADMGHVQCSPDPCASTYTVTFSRPNPGCPFTPSQGVKRLVCPTASRLLLGTVTKISGDQLTFRTDLGQF